MSDTQQTRHGGARGHPDDTGATRDTDDRHERVPVWAWVAGGALLAAGLGVLVLGRGGTAVLVGIALTFAALATVLLSLPDRDPAED